MAVAACVCVLCVRDREREIRWDESRQLQWPWVKGIGEMSAAGACALVRLCLKVRERLAREKRVKHRNVMYIVTEDGGWTVLPVPLKSTGALHLLKHHCVTIHCASSCQRHFYQDGYPQNYTVFSVPGSVSVTCQRQLHSLNILPNCQVRSADCF